MSCKVRDYSTMRPMRLVGSEAGFAKYEVGRLVWIAATWCGQGHAGVDEWPPELVMPGGSGEDCPGCIDVQRQLGVL